MPPLVDDEGRGVGGGSCEGGCVMVLGDDTSRVSSCCRNCHHSSDDVGFSSTASLSLLRSMIAADGRRDTLEGRTYCWSCVTQDRVPVCVRSASKSIMAVSVKTFSFQTVISS